jgi:hypothetical protein
VKTHAHLRHVLAAGAVGALTFGLYCSSLAPTVGAGDSGELITAAWGLGVAHPPGYPLWCLLGFLFSHALPIGSVAYRLNLLSALLGSAAAAGLSLLLTRRGARAWVAAAGGLLFAVSESLWSQAVDVEVYTLSAAATVAFLLFFERCVEYPSPARVAAAALAFGLGLAAHPNVAMLGPLWVLAALARRADMTRRQLAAGALAAQTVWVGLLPYALYLPLAAAAQPALNWGDPSTLERWMAHVSRAQYGGYSWPGLTPSLVMVGRSLVLLAGELLWVGVPVAVLGIAASWGTRLQARLDVLALACSGPLYAVLLAGLLRGEQLEDVRGYFVGAVAIAVILAARGMECLLERWGAIPSARLWVIGGVILLGCAGVVRWGDLNQRGNWVAHDYASALLQSMPPSSDLYAQGDHELFPIMYLQAVEGYRPDVRLFDAAEPTAERDAYGYPQAQHIGRPELTTVPLGELNSGMVPWGLALFILSDISPALPGRMPPPLLHEPPVPVERLGRLERDLLTRYHLAQARYAWSLGDLGTTVFEIERGAWLAVDNPKELNNLATFCAREGLPDLAERIWTQALAIDPDYVVAQRNLDLLRAQAGYDGQRAQ